MTASSADSGQPYLARRQNWVNQVAGGWFHPGDLVRQDDEGYLWVVYREGGVTIPGGEDGYCAEVGNALAERPARCEPPKALEVVDARPQDPAGKVLRTELRARFGTGSSVEAGQSSSAATVSANSVTG